MRALGVDDRLSWLLVPWLGLTSPSACCARIVIGLTTDVTLGAALCGAPQPVALPARREDDEDRPDSSIRAGARCSA